MRVAFFAAVAMPRLRSTIMASSRSPFASVRAFLQSIMGAPLRSRNSFTWAAEMFVVSVLMKINFLQFERALQHTTRVVVARAGRVNDIEVAGWHAFQR